MCGNTDTHINLRTVTLQEPSLSCYSSQVLYNTANHNDIF